MYKSLGHTTQFDYDRNGRLTETKDARGHSQTQDYDGAGNVIQKEDANGNITQYFYDGLNRLETVINARNETTAYTYDNVSNLLTQTDGKGNVTTMQYNCRNMLTARIDPGGILANQTIDETKVEMYTYYANGNLWTRKDRNTMLPPPLWLLSDAVEGYTYDIHGRLLSKSIGDETIGYTYDDNGNQLTVTNTSGIVTRVYDELNRTISKTISGQGEFTYQYDVTSGVPSYYTADIITDPKSNVTMKVYDRAGRLSQVIAGSDTTTYTYFDNGNRESVTYPNGLTADYTYYDDNRLYTLANKDGATILEAFSYAYDDNGNMSSKTDVKGTTSFTYDALNRLESITEPDGTVTGYTYDAAGNREGKTVTANNETTTTSYDYNAQNRLTGTEEDLSTGESVLTDYFYDHNGNTTATREQTLEDAVAGQTVNPAVADDLSGSSLYEYDNFDQLTAAAKDEYTLHMAYNGEGLRVSKEVTVDSLSAETQYAYENDNVVLELDGSGDQTAYNVYGGDMLVSRAAGGETLYYLYNGHGDVTALTDGDGDVVASYYYDVFGNVVEETGAADNSVNYAGYEYDEETGLYYLNARYYDPETARFLTEDTYYGTSSDPLSLNLYTYCSNNPIIYIDPSGHALTQWDVEHLSASEIATVIAATNAWNAANAAGDTAGMAAAQAAASDARSGNLSDNEEQLSNGIVVDKNSTTSQTVSAWVGDDQGIIQVTVPASTTDTSATTTGSSTSNTNNTVQITYTVQSGDSLSKIASRYGTTVEAIAAANGIQNINLINVGQQLVMPQGAELVSSTTYTSSASSGTKTSTTTANTTSTAASSSKSTAAYKNTATTSTTTTKATNNVNTSASQSSTASEVMGSTVINYCTTALQAIATTVAKNAGAGSVVSNVPMIAIAGAAAGAMIDCQKYDGAARTTAVAITVGSALAVWGIGAILAATTLPLAATFGISILVGTAVSILSNKLKTKYCG